MKKKKYFILFLLLFLFNNKVYAACNDAELNDLAEKFTVNYSEDYGNKIRLTDGTVIEGEREYAYLLVFSPYSDKLKIVVTNSLDNSVKEATYHKDRNRYVVGSYIHYDEKEYKVNVYGNSSSACPNQLLKTTSITIPPFNEYSLYKECENNSESEMCSMMKDTSNVSLEDYKKAMNEETKQNEEKNISTSKKILNNVIKYGLFILIPILVISIYYFIRIHIYKKKVNNR